jgi:precorrin-4/cobalt-precorrin-4 C11-methyltransferase
MVIHLSIMNLSRIVRELLPVYGAECPVVVVHRASWPDELVLRGTMGTIEELVTVAGIHSNALILIGRSLGNEAFGESYLYSLSRERDAGNE